MNAPWILLTASDRQLAIDSVRTLLGALGQDPESAQLKRTPERVVDLLTDLLTGTTRDPASAVRESGTPLGLEAAGELVAVTDLHFRSLCEHHLLPFEGTANVYYLPRNRIAGIGRIVDVVEIVARRLQLQERVGQEIADAIHAGLDTLGVLVVLEARHGCVHRSHTQVASAPVLSMATTGAVPERVRDLAMRRVA